MVETFYGISSLETKGYIEHHLKVAGAHRPLFFNDTGRTHLPVREGDSAPNQQLVYSMPSGRLSGREVGYRRRYGKEGFAGIQRQLVLVTDGRDRRYLSLPPVLSSSSSPWKIQHAGIIMLEDSGNLIMATTRYLQTGRNKILFKAKDTSGVTFYASSVDYSYCHIFISVTYSGLSLGLQSQ